MVREFCDLRIPCLSQDLKTLSCVFTQKLCCFSCAFRFGIYLKPILCRWCEVAVEVYISQCGRPGAPSISKTVLSSGR